MLPEASMLLSMRKLLRAYRSRAFYLSLASRSHLTLDTVFCPAHVNV